MWSFGIYDAIKGYAYSVCAKGFSGLLNNSKIGLINEWIGLALLGNISCSILGGYRTLVADGELLVTMPEGNKEIMRRSTIKISVFIFIFAGLFIMDRYLFMDGRIIHGNWSFGSGDYMGVDPMHFGQHGEL